MRLLWQSGVTLRAFRCDPAGFRTTLDRFLKGSWKGAMNDMLPMEGFIKRTVGDTARVLEAILDNDKSTDDLIDELADLVSGLNPVVRDVRKAMKGGEE